MAKKRGVVLRDVSRAECHWLTRTVLAGETVYQFGEPLSNGNIAVTSKPDDEQLFFLPTAAIEFKPEEAIDDAEVGGIALTSQAMVDEFSLPAQSLGAAANESATVDNADGPFEVGDGGRSGGAGASGDFKADPVEPSEAEQAGGEPSNDAPEQIADAGSDIIDTGVDSSSGGEEG